MKNRTIFLFLSALVIVAMVAGCGPKPTAEPEPQVTEVPATAEPTEAPDECVTSDAVLNGAAIINAIVVNFNPFANNPNWPTVKGIFEPLMVFNTLKAELVPWLADSYTWSEDFKTLTFKLHEGVKWSDGEPFTANDIVFTFNLLKNTAGLNGSGLTALNGAVDTFTAADDLTVVFTFKAVDTMSIYDITNQDIVPEHIWKDVADPATFPNETPVGTGPFTELVDFQSQVYQLDKSLLLAALQAFLQEPARHRLLRK